MTKKWQHITTIVIFSLLIKLMYLFFAQLTLGEAITSRPLQEQYAFTIKKNDAYWYQSIAQNGYDSPESGKNLDTLSKYEQSGWAFFPLYPAMNYAVMSTFGFSFDQSGVILSIIFSTLVMICFYLFCSLYFDNRQKALYTCIFLFSFPFHYFFSVMYTEAVFLTLVLVCFHSIYLRRYFVLLLLLPFLVWVRPNGIIMLVPLYLWYLEREALLGKYFIRMRSIFTRENLLRSLFFVTGPIAFLLYGWYQYESTGYFNAFKVAMEIGWDRSFTWPFKALFSHGVWHVQLYSIYALIFIVVSFLFRKKLPISMLVLIFIGWFLPLTTGTMISMPRYISVLFPFFMILGGVIYKLHKALRWSLIPVLLALQCCMFYFWLLSHSAGY